MSQKTLFSDSPFFIAKPVLAKNIHGSIIEVRAEKIINMNLGEINGSDN